MSWCVLTELTSICPSRRRGRDTAARRPDFLPPAPVTLAIGSTSQRLRLQKGAKWNGSAAWRASDRGAASGLDQFWDFGQFLPVSTLRRRNQPESRVKVETTPFCSLAFAFGMDGPFWPGWILARVASENEQ
jgi:hypothetical protein